MPHMMCIEDQLNDHICGVWKPAEPYYENPITIRICEVNGCKSESTQLGKKCKKHNEILINKCRICHKNKIYKYKKCKRCQHKYV